MQHIGGRVLFEKMRFKYGSIFYGQKRVEVNREEDGLYFRVLVGFYPSNDVEFTKSKVNVEEWTDRLASVGIEGWRDRYQTSAFVPDSKEWVLELKDTEDLKWISRGGKNRFPENWDLLISLMNELAGEELYKE